MVRGIVWFRNDLRLHDNEALTDAIKNCDEVLPVYVFDERIYRGYTKFGFRKADRHRTKFVIEAVKNLRENLQKLGLNLYIRIGKQEDVLCDLATQVKSSWIFCNRERTNEELRVQDKIEKSIWTVGQEIRFYRGKMLYHTGDLPFPITQTPDIFTNFRKEVEKFVEIRQPLPKPTEPIRPVSISLDFGKVPELVDFNLSEEEADITVFQGGETSGIRQVEKYFWETNNIESYFDTRNQLWGVEFSSRFSAYLAQGCISPKYIMQQLKRYEAERTENKSTYWLFFELLWRDFFRLMAKKHGNAIFKLGGINQTENQESKVDWRLIGKWQDGKTGIPFIDANMRELKRTGFMSNRGRQNVASFLIKDLKQNWLVGAEYFESMLVDYDPCSNYGNWNYIAGVGCDPREERYFNILGQSRKYDANGEYIKHWLPELDQIDEKSIHALESGKPDNYPSPLVPFDTWS
jgi:deoxyribodipyrimidine photo-lyase